MKRARALKKTAAEREVCRDKDVEIERLRAEISQLSETVQDQKGKIAKFSVYWQFMEKVLDWADEVSHGPPHTQRPCSLFTCNI